MEAKRAQEFPHQKSGQLFFCFQMVLKFLQLFSLLGFNNDSTRVYEDVYISEEKYYRYSGEGTSGNMEMKVINKMKIVLMYLGWQCSYLFT
jgi:hypothetical protein